MTLEDRCRFIHDHTPIGTYIIHLAPNRCSRLRSLRESIYHNYKRNHLDNRTCIDSRYYIEMYHPIRHLKHIRYPTSRSLFIVVTQLFHMSSSSLIKYNTPIRHHDECVTWLLLWIFARIQKQSLLHILDRSRLCIDWLISTTNTDRSLVIITSVQTDTDIVVNNNPLTPTHRWVFNDRNVKHEHLLLNTPSLYFSLWQNNNIHSSTIYRWWLVLF
jgi:hypothetical protein